MTRRPDFWAAQYRAMERYLTEGRNPRWLRAIRAMEAQRKRWDAQHQVAA